MARPKKSLGQNFLVDPNIQRRIANAVDPQPVDEILEIGPGKGAITQYLAETARRFTAIELDRDLAASLRERYADTANVRIIEGDALKLDLDQVSDHTDQLKVAGNIPYNITTPLLFHLLSRKWRPAHIVLMLQKEVADRILAGPGDAAYGALSVGVQTVARVERLFHVSRNAFRPVPKVDSSVVRIVPIRPFPLSQGEEADLRALTRASFGWRRKQLQRTLRSSPDYGLATTDIVNVEERTGIPLERRPEALAPHEFVRLAAELRLAGWPRLPS
jgi:16S rRNA (adenine1518-N6/adenine1519-N6)-dimethyltransferase